MKKFAALLLAVVSVADCVPDRTAHAWPGHPARPADRGRPVPLRLPDPVSRPTTRTGFKRLLTEGAVFTNANLEHYPTVTAIGHATMLTGATPSVSGIIGNDWFDRETGATVTSVSDPTVKPLGSPTGSAASPRRLLVSTVGDELKLARWRRKARRRAARLRRVVEGSLRDPAGRAAAPMARTGGTRRPGRSSRARTTCPTAPAWVTAFNDRKLADEDAGASWTRAGGPVHGR